ncbi:hypothetical protein M7775_10220 [Sporomusa sphaeroides DSM 2875]|uniref:hypothetical protein n=1 Tax=Sporomusa sphaeroides TaxID=47679 RepID=UPI002030821E|nr:hypothetical protein [Sporomusa sphaeroides]MCM0758938.1 hypothetical protein [Sporomusa sphaeroides DSM 2875]
MKLLCKIVLLALAGLHLIKPFVTIDLSAAICITAVVVLLSGMTMMGKGFFKATLTFLFIGLALLFYFGQPLSIWTAAVTSMTNVIAILVVMQTFSIPIKIGQYNTALQYWLNKSVRGEGPLFLLTTAATHVFTSFLMFGAIPVMISLMEHTLKKSVGNYQRFMAAAVSRGYALASLWAPGAINLFLVIQATGVSWSAVFVPGVILSFIGMAISYGIESKLHLKADAVRPDVSGAQGLPAEKPAGRRVLHIFLAVAGLIMLTLLFDRLHIGATYNRIILAGFVVIFVWLSWLSREVSITAAVKSYWQEGVLKTADLAPFFIAMGIFSTALEHSGFMVLLQAALQQAAGVLGVFSIVLVPLLIILAAVFGLHPFMTIVMFGKILTLLSLPVTSLTLALCLAVGGSISYMVSPFAGLILTLAKMINAKAEEVALRWNWQFCLVYFFVGIVFAYYWGQNM